MNETQAITVYLRDGRSFSHKRAIHFEKDDLFVVVVDGPKAMSWYATCDVARIRAEPNI